MINTDEGKANAEYILGAGYNGPEEGNMSEYDSSVAYTGTVNNYRANPVFRFKVEARVVVGDAGSDAQWSVISEQTAIIQPLAPSPPFNKKMKFYEMNTKDVSGATIRQVDLIGIEITSESIVNIVNDDGNKYVFNNDIYDPDGVWSMRNGVYVFKNISQSHPMAILNNGKLDSITYTGDSDKLYRKR